MVTLDMINLAIEGVAQQSSTSQWSRPNDAQGAINGVKTGSFGFHTDFEDAAWWSIDLNLTVEIFEIVIFNREDCCSDRSRSLSVEISNDGKTYKRIYGGINYFGGIISNMPLRIRLNSQVRARYVKLQLEEPSVLHLDQVEVFVERKYVVASRRLKNFCQNNEIDFVTLSGTDCLSSSEGIRLEGNLEATTITSLKVNRYGRFGNCVEQLINALYLAERLNIARVFFDRTAFFGIDLELDSDSILQPLEHWNENELSLTGYFFSGVNFFENGGGLDSGSARAIIQLKIKPLLSSLCKQVDASDSDRLFVHFRAGDVFNAPLVHTQYFQPPLTYYKVAISHAVENLAIRSITLVFEDMGNPCIAPTISFVETLGLPVVLQSASLSDDVRALLSARHIVFSFGTLGDAIRMLSNNLRNAYYFHKPGNFRIPQRRTPYFVFGAPSVRSIVVDDAMGEYLNAGDWKNSATQRALMLDYPADNLQISLIAPD